MHRYLKALFCALLVLSIVEPIKSKRSFSSGRHSYPKPSGGLSGGGHGYPSSGGHSGTGGHGYPSSGGLSGTGGGHGYPSSGGHSGTGGHGYPSSGGLSGTGGGHGYPSSGGQPGTGGHRYPTSGGSHGYPSSGTHGSSLSGNTPSRTGTGAGHTTNVHYHYNYNPPQQIRYTPAHGGPPMNYPVYHGSPPTYVYKYKDSNSKYGTLLAGLALLNLGTLGVATYAAAKAHSGSGQNYVTKPGEVCKFGLRKDNGDYEETKIECNLISSFIYEEEAKKQSGGTNSTVVTTTVTNVTTVNTNGSDLPPQVANTLYEMLPNGTLVPVNSTIANTTATNTPVSPGTVTSSVTVTTTNTTSALDVIGKPVEVTPGMKCYVIRHSPTSNMKRSVPCGLLQTYATQSLKKNAASRNLPVFTILSVVVAVFVAC